MKTKLFGLLILIMGLMYGCSELINDDIEVKSGTVTVSLTDAPFPHDLVEAVNVTIDSVRFIIADDEETDETGEEGRDDESGFITLEVNKTFNLLELGNGETEILGDLEIPAGEYSEIRMHVVEAKIKVKDVVEEMDIKIPSGYSSGLKIKIKPSLVINEDEDYQVLLDFDVSRSFIVKGNSKDSETLDFLFKPVIRAVNIAMTGNLSGVVAEDIEEGAFIKNAHIYVISAEDIRDTIASGKTNEEGFYRIIGITGGTYNITCEKEEYENVYEPEEVVIVVGEEVTKDFLLKKSEEEEVTEGS